MDKYILSSKSLKEIEEIVTELGEPKFRAKQLYSWIYTKFASDFDSMTDISKSFRENLKQNAIISEVKIKQRQISADKTIKYLLEYPDGNVVECVLMRFDNRPNLTACVSSQIGCPVGCVFCATGQSGFVRNLTTREITEQIMIMQRDTGLRISNVVFMGQGEPLLNLDNVLPAIDFINVSLLILDGLKEKREEIVGPLPVYSVRNHKKEDEILTIKKAEAEGKVVVQKITELLKIQIYDAKKQQSRPIGFSDIAILNS